MKKYWIKNLNENQVIHAPTEEIAKKLCNKFNKIGLQWSSGDIYLSETNWRFHEEKTCYSPSEGRYCDLVYYIEHGHEILSIDQLLDFQANEYPKVMDVSNDNHNWWKRVVFMEKNGKFLAWWDAESIEKAEDEVYTGVWSFAREVKPATTLELTLDEIAEKFNVSPEQIKIKK